MLKFPYGINNFYNIITKNYYYVDRTSFMPLIENAGVQLLFLRPRRFGKTLLLSMLENYYDVAKASEFKRLFGHLAIGQNPTPEHNQYFVMTWDFSNVSPEGKASKIQQTLYRYINKCIQYFALYYQAWLPFEIEIEPEDAVASFLSLLTAVKLSQYSLYLLIDEYDNFANELMMGSRENSASRYDALLSGEGALKALFKTVKSAISRLPHGDALIIQALNEVPPLSIPDLANRFGVQDMLYASKDTSFLVSLLYYFGILTLNGETEFGKLRFKIPN